MSQVSSNIEVLTSKLAFPKNVEDVKLLVSDSAEHVLMWAQSPSAIAQMATVVAALFLAPLISLIIRKRLSIFKAEPQTGQFLALKRGLYKSQGYLTAIVLIGLLAIGASALRANASFGADNLVKIVQGLVVIFILHRIITRLSVDTLQEKIAKWTVIPVALMMVFGYFGKFLGRLEAAEIFKLGETPITALTGVKLVIYGALFFWLGGISNTKGQTTIRSQASLDIATREVVAKIFQMVLFTAVFILILTFAGVPLSGLVIIISALGLGIGLGLQPVAANFVSGLIILFDRSVQIGDFLELPDGTQGHVEAINMRSTTVETTDGKDIMVPNTLFIEEAYQNWTHKDPRQRYEVYFSVTYDTNIDKLEDILIPAILEYSKVLREPEMPDLELREFGDWGIKFAIEFWADGIDDGENKFTSDLNFIIWRTLKKHKIKMPLPQNEVRLLK